MPIAGERQRGEGERRRGDEEHHEADNAPGPIDKQGFDFAIFDNCAEDPMRDDARDELGERASGGQSADRDGDRLVDGAFSVVSRSLRGTFGRCYADRSGRQKFGCERRQPR